MKSSSSFNYTFVSNKFESKLPLYCTTADMRPGPSAVIFVLVRANLPKQINPTPKSENREKSLRIL